MQEASVLRSKVCALCGAHYPADALFCPKDGAPLQSAAGAEREAADPYLGMEISGHIEIQQLAGVGAMGRVYRAFQRGIDRDVAVKILHRELSANSQLVSRFTREAKVASRLQHPNVVQVLLAGQLEDRALYMVMEYLDGLSLQSALAAAGGALPLARALHIGLQLCEAAGEAHAQGIVHRDLKPENVMLVRRGADPDFVKVLDFGIARMDWGEQSVATAAGLIFGTARYISPEGAQGSAVTPASDVYAIATLLFQMLSGRTPFDGDQAVALLVQQIHDPPPSLRSVARAEYVPEPICDVVMANLAKDPKLREPDARSLGHALMDAAKAAGLSAEDISRPHHRRQPSAIQLPPVNRTKQMDLGPELADRLTPPSPSDEASKGPKRPPMAATAKWEPPADFAAKLGDFTPAPRPSGVVAPPSSRPRTIDETLDDHDAAPPVDLPSSPSFPRPVAKTVADERAPATQYSPPIEPTPEPPRGRITSPPSHGSYASVPPPRSKGLLVVVLCFVIGAILAAGVAWKLGRIGGDNERETFVARATEAMFKNRFAEPPGDNVREITDEGLRRFPSDRRLLDVRARAANELVTQALAHRSTGDTPGALKLARLARELDPADPSAKRLVEQYESELALAPPASTAPPLGAPPATVVAPSAKVPVVPPAAGARVQVDVAATPQVGQSVAIVAHVLPAKGAVDGASFMVVGPGVPGGARVDAQPAGAFDFKGNYTFSQAGKFDVTFVANVDGKPVRGSRVVNTSGPAAPPASLPPAPPPTPSTAPSVKWL